AGRPAGSGVTISPGWTSAARALTLTAPERPGAPAETERGKPVEMLKHLIDFVLHLDRHLGPIIQEYGVWTYLILFAVVFCETGLVVTPFLPGDSLLFLAGVFAGRGSLSLAVLILVLIAAAVVGDTVNYWVGHFLGHRLIASKRRLIKPEHLAYTHE